MENLPQFGAAVGFTAAGGAMIFYEWSRLKSDRPLLKGRAVIDLYWMVYLTLLVLGLIFFIDAIIR